MRRSGGVMAGDMMFIVIVEDEEKAELSPGKQVRATKRCQ